MKIIVSIIFVLFYYNQAFSQNTNVDNSNSYITINNVMYHKDSINFRYDVLDTGFRQIVNNDLSFLIEEGNYYDFKVYKISKRSNSYFINASTVINDTIVLVDIITFNRNWDNKNKNKIRPGKYYKIKLQRYFKNPLYNGIEYKPIYNVMLGKEAIGVLSTGYIDYLFVSQNLSGLNYADSSQIINIEKDKLKYEEKIHTFLFQVVKSITFAEDSSLLINYIDSIQIKESLRTYPITVLGGFSPSEPISNYQPKKIPKEIWFNIDTNSFNTWFWQVLKENYRLPQSNNKNNFQNDDVETDILYLQNDIFTVRVKWSIPSSNEVFNAVFIIKKESDFKVIGFNRISNF